MSFQIVEFDDGLHAIPFSWLSNDNKQAYWPPYKDSIKICKSIANMQTPVEDDWELLPVLDIHGSADTYPEAATKLKLMSDASDMENFVSDEALKKSRARRHRVPTGSSQRFEENEDDQSEKNARKKPLPNKPAGFVTVTDNLKKNDRQVVPASRSVAPASTILHTVAEDEAAEHEIEIEGDTLRKPRSSKVCRSFELSEFHTEILRTMNQIMEKLHDMNSRLKIIEESCNANRFKQLLEVQDDNTNENEDLIEDLLPLGTLLEFDELENKLQEKQFASRMIQFLKSVGGKDTHDFLFNILKRSLKNSVAVEFSMDGKKKKKPMRNTNFLKMILKAAKLHRPNLDEADAIKIISAWLAAAKLRCTREQSKLALNGPPGEVEDHN